MLNQKNACLMYATYRYTCNLCQAEQDEQKIGLNLVVLTGVRVLLQISVPFTPLSTFRFQPLPAVATYGIDVDITFHYVTSQFSAFGRLGVARRSLALLAGFAALVALAGVGSHNVQQQLAQVAEPWGGPLHPITLYYR